jgi:hypothetical protein
VQQRRDHALAKVIKPFEENAKLYWLASPGLKKCEIQSAHHWSHEESKRDNAPDQNSNRRHTKEKPILFLHQLPAGAKTFGRLNSVAFKFRI